MTVARIAIQTTEESKNFLALRKTDARFQTMPSIVLRYLTGVRGLVLGRKIKISLLFIENKQHPQWSST